MYEYKGFIYLQCCNGDENTPHIFPNKEEYFDEKRLWWKAKETKCLRCNEENILEQQSFGDICMRSKSKEHDWISTSHVNENGICFMQQECKNCKSGYSVPLI